jgi:predicted ATPase/class 3 adenylate cyclase
VTFLFTDLEGSTRLWEEHPEAMRDALKRHDELLVAAVEAHGGYLVKTTGDGIHAAFATADAAVLAAIDGQRALVGERWESTGPLKVRMGLHTGAAELRDGDYYGPALNRAARLMAAAHGGQIVISHVTEELVRDGLPMGIELLDLGDQRLRDLGRSERVFQVNAAGLPHLFSALRTLDSLPGNLPRQRTAFVGRKRELAELSALLETSAVLTLTGPGGVGKTRLAIELAAEAITRFPDGAWFVDFAPISDPELLAMTVVTSLQVPVPRSGRVEDALVTALRSQHALIVLDNCEHLVDVVAALVDELARECHRLTVIVTSREALGIHGEQVVPVRPLPAPTADHQSVSEVLTNDAVTLFVDRARATSHGYEVTTENAAAVSELVRRLDGIPLAIELAAARVGSMTPADMVARLNERFRLLRQGRRTALSRHQTLRGAIDWSYTLLDELEAIVFARLSVFGGGFTAEAAEAVVADERVDSIDVLDIVSDLVTKSMLVAAEHEGAIRYRMLETLREYGRERLGELGETDRLHERHAAYYVAFAQQAAPHIKGPLDGMWSARILLELDNVRGALVWAEENDPSVLVQLIGALGIFWHQQRPREGWEWVQVALRIDETMGGVPHPELLAIAGLIANDAGLPDAEEHLRRSLQAAEATSAETRRSMALGSLAYFHLETGRPSEARELAEQAVEAARGEGDQYELIDALIAQSYVHSFTDDLSRGRAIADEALDLAEKFGNGYLLGFAVSAAGVARYRDDPARAVQLLDSAETWHADPSRLGVNRAFRGVARMSLHDYAGAARELDASLRLYQVVGNQYYMRFSLQLVSGLLMAVGAWEPAVQLLSATEHLRENAVFVGAPIEESAHDRMRQRLERAVDSEMFEALRARGREMSLGGALELAYRQLAEIAAET